MPIDISLVVNGKKISAAVEPNRLLVDFLRDDQHLTGSHIGCDTAQCGACTIHMDGAAVKACAILAVQADGSDILTIEGLAEGDHLHPMQQAFRDHHGLQCGFCTPGMVLAAIGIVEQHGLPDKTTIRRELEGNFCRCTGYRNIVAAIEAGAKAMAE